MNLSQAIAARRTIRGYKPDPVPQEVLEEIFTKAQQAPSNCNTQPWQVKVVSGEVRRKLEEKFIAELMTGAQPQPFFKPGDKDLQGVYRERQVDCAVRYYGVMDIGRDDKQARMMLAAKNWQFFGAPHAAFISMPKTMSEVNAIDIGIYLQTLMLLMVEYGLASCPQGALAMYPEPVRELIGLDEDQALLCGLSFGYPDEGAQINKTIMDRVPLSDSVTFYS